MRVAVIGGGLAGGAAACLLAQGGASVTLLERDAAPADKVCGEFLSIEAQGVLRGLGLDPAALGGVPIDLVRVARGSDVAEAALPFRALGLSRMVLDEALLRHAVACGAVVRRGVAAQAVASPAGVRVLAPGLPQGHDAVLLATGKHDLRGLRRRPARPPEELVGFKTYFRLAPQQARELAGAVEVSLFADGYAGLQMVEGGRANLCLLTPRARLQAAGGDWDRLLAALLAEAPPLARRLAGATALLARPLSIFRVPYGFRHLPGADDPPALFRLGDQAGVIPSFTGDGMAIALHSARLAADCLLGGVPAAEYHRLLARDTARPMQVAGALYRIGRVPAGQAVLMALLRRAPSLLRRAATLTRMPQPGRPAALAEAA